MIFFISWDIQSKTANENDMVKRPPKTLNTPRYNNVAEALEGIEKKRAALFHKKETRYTLADGISVFTDLWSKLFREHFSDYPPVPISKTRQVPRIKRQIVAPLREAGIPVSQFLHFLFERWQLLRGSRYFEKFKTYPDRPAIDWVLKFSEMYISAFMEVRDGGDIQGSEQPAETSKVQDKEANTAKAALLATRRTLLEKERKLRKLEQENQRLRTRPSRSKLSRTAKTKLPPKWE